jgi:hypothetical protein
MVVPGQEDRNSLDGCATRTGRLLPFSAGARRATVQDAPDANRDGR